ncbi:MAG: hypothetical protein PHQ05_11260 [Sterolibacterium sp.]|nr:hypothetical protein [Sterolibacterium sp.]
MNSHLAQLDPCPFEKLRRLFTGIKPPKGLKEIKCSIGEPQHETPEFIKQTLTDNLSGLALYPSTQGSDVLRQVIAAWNDEAHVRDNRRLYAEKFETPNFA